MTTTGMTPDDISALVRQEVARERAADHAARNRLLPPAIGRERSEAENRQAADLKARQEAAAAAEDARLERVRKLAPRAAKVKRQLDDLKERFAEATAAREAAEQVWQALDDEQMRLQGRLARLQWGDDV
jgi:chromosome segregation ATPase